MTNETYFQLEGEFLGVCDLDGYKLKYMRLSDQSNLLELEDPN